MQSSWKKGRAEANFTGQIGNKEHRGRAAERRPRECDAWVSSSVCVSGVCIRGCAAQVREGWEEPNTEAGRIQGRRT